MGRRSRSRFAVAAAGLLAVVCGVAALCRQRSVSATYTPPPQEAARAARWVKMDRLCGEIELELVRDASGHKTIQSIVGEMTRARGTDYFTVDNGRTELFFNTSAAQWTGAALHDPLMYARITDENGDRAEVLGPGFVAVPWAQFQSELGGKHLAFRSARNLGADQRALSQ